MKFKAAMLGLAGLLAASAPLAQAPGYPNRPVRLVVGFPPGGGVDINARLMAPKLAESLGQQFVVDNRPGAGTNIANELVAKSAPDGYTLLVNTAALAINMSLYRNLPFDALRDFAPVSLFSESPNVMVVPAKLPAANVKEVIALARSSPGKLNYSSAGVGTTQHLAAELFKLRAGLFIVHIPYKGSAPSLTALMASEVDLSFANIPAILQHVRSGRLRALATLAAKRDPQLPDVPTMKEAGLEGVEVSVWYGVFAPAATPPEIVKTLAGAIAKAARDPDTRKRLLDQGAEPIGSSPAEFAKFMRDEVARWTEVVKVSGARRLNERCRPAAPGHTAARAEAAIAARDGGLSRITPFTGAQMKIGFIGLGLMGLPMASNLLAAGHTLRVNDLRPDAARGLLGAGAAWAGDAAVAVRDVEVVFTSLPGPPEVEAVSATLIRSIPQGAAWFDLTTNSPELVRRLHSLCAARGVQLLDAPVSGGPKGARAGRLALWVGGDKPTFERFQPVLKTIGDQPLFVGAIGAGSVAKLTHNCASFMIQAALAEAFTLGVKAGVEPLALFRALRHGAAGRARTFDRLADYFLPGRYDPPDFALRLAHKDMTLALELARDNGVPMRAAEHTMAELAEALARGWGERDARVAMLLQEERAQVSVRVAPERLKDALG